jgi:hypothetical protein
MPKAESFYQREHLRKDKSPMKTVAQFVASKTISYWYRVSEKERNHDRPPPEFRPLNRCSSFLSAPNGQRDTQGSQTGR